MDLRLDCFSGQCFCLFFRYLHVLHKLKLKRTSLPQDAASSTPFDGYGIYESCSPKNAAMCLSHLNDMAAAGFKLVINYDELYGDASFQKAYLDRAQSVGMKVIVTLKIPGLL